MCTLSGSKENVEHLSNWKTGQLAEAQVEGGWKGGGERGGQNTEETHSGVLSLIRRQKGPRKDFNDISLILFFFEPK